MTDQDDDDLARFRELCEVVDALKSRHDIALDRFKAASMSGDTSVATLNILKGDINISASALRDAEALADAATPRLIIDFMATREERPQPPLVVNDKATKH